MMKDRWLLLLLSLLLTTGMAFAGTPDKAATATPSVWENPPATPADELDEIMWMEDWEDPDVEDYWTGTDPVIQDNYWTTDDWMPYEGTNAWRCFLPELGDPEYGGYDDDWLQVMLTQPIDVSGVTDLDLSFWFRMNAEEPDWDGGNVWIFYGDAPNDWAGQIVATPIAPAYTETDMNAFDLWFNPDLQYPGWSGRDGLGFDEYTEATFDFGAYATDYDYVQIAFIFATDHYIDSNDYPQMFGWQIDNIEVTSGANTLWADDADGGNIGGDPIFVSGFDAVPGNPVPMTWDVLDVGGGNAISGTHVVGIEEVPFRTRFNHYYEGPEFDLPELEDGEDYYLDCYFRSEFEELDNPSTEDIAWWRTEVWIPSENQWVAASAVDGTNNYIYGQQTGGDWWLFSEMFAERWNMNSIAGETGIKVRTAWHSPDEQFTFDYFWIDDIIMHKEALEYDVSTMLILPYPTTVGMPVYGNAVITNNAGNTAEDVLPTWSLGGATYPMWPTGTLDDILPNEFDDTRFIDVPGDDDQGFWTPMESQTGQRTISATAIYAADEIQENNTYSTEAVIETEDRYEVGVDTRNFYGSLSIHDLNTGPVVHIDPAVVNADVYGDFEDYDIQQLNVRGWFWNADGTTGGAQANPQLQLTVYADGTTPGAVLWSELVDIVQLDGSAIAEGYEGDCMVAVDVSDVAALQDLTTPFWIGVELTMMDVNGVYAQPLINRTGPYAPWQDYQFQELDDANSGNTLSDWGHHLSATLAGSFADVDPQAAGSLPMEYALNAAYPNPFNPTTTLRYALPAPGEVRLTVVNSLGQQVASLVDGMKTAGQHTVVFDGAGLASGVYLVRMQAADFTAVQKVVLMK